jgi:hypothetical protein
VISSLASTETFRLVSLLTDVLEGPPFKVKTTSKWNTSGILTIKRHYLAFVGCQGWVESEDTGHGEVRWLCTGWLTSRACVREAVFRMAASAGLSGLSGSNLSFAAAFCDKAGQFGGNRAIPFHSFLCRVGW